ELLLVASRRAGSSPVCDVIRYRTAQNTIASVWEGCPPGNQPGRLPLCQNEVGDAGMITRLKPMVRRLAGLSAFLFVVSGIGLSQGPAKDPGVRGGPPRAGTSFGGLSTGLTQLFQAGAAKFAKTDTVVG